MSSSLPSGTLVIAEKKTLATSIAAAFDGAVLKGNYYETPGGGKIGWSRGHLFEFSDFDTYIPEQMAGSWQKSRSILPLIPPRLKRQFKDSQAKASFGVLKDLVGQARTIVHAGDPDREGQAIVDETLETLGWRGPVLRFWTTALDRKSIQAAFSKMADNESRRSLRFAQRCRNEGDYLLGMNFTRIYTVDGGQFFRVGRVKTPTLALVVWRDRKIAAFKVSDFYVPVIAPLWKSAAFEARFLVPSDDFQAKMDESGRLIDRAEAQRIVDAGVADKSNRVVASNFANKEQQAPLPYSTLELQAAGSRRYGFTAQQTLDLAASLYQKGITTYPRVDCRYFPESFHETAVESLRPFADELKLDLARKHSAFSDKNVADHAHYAIGLTGQGGSMTDDELKVYGIIRDSIAALFTPPWRYRSGELRIKSGSWAGGIDLIWSAKGRATIDPGWKRILGKNEEEDEEMTLPEIPVGTKLEIPSGRLEAKKTTPPAYFTDATLTAAMDNIHTVVDDPRAKAMLKEVSGIGTNATRATVIEELISGNLLRRDKKLVKATPAGHTLIDSLESINSPLCDPVLTAQWEEKLTAIAKLPPERAESAYQGMMQETIAAMREWAGLKIKASGGVECPKCHEPACRQFKSKAKGTMFWRCSACDSGFQDAGKKPGEAFRSREQQEGVECPKCRAHAVVRLESNKKPGVFYFSCTAPECRKNFADDGGKVGHCFDDPRPSEAGGVCPSCRNATVIRLESTKKPGLFYHRCTTRTCNKAFADEGGKVGPEFGAAVAGEACPACKAKTLVRRESKNKPGVFYWRCTTSTCDKGFGDNNGAVGDEFGGGSKSGGKSPPPPARGKSGSKSGGKSSGRGR